MTIWLGLGIWLFLSAEIYFSYVIITVLEKRNAKRS
jgi:hypothetical protein